MKLKKIILNVTDKCNFKCTYCYQNIGKYENVMNWETCKNAIDFFLDNSYKNISIDFSGGEPLLNFPIIEKAVEYSKKKAVEMNKNILYSIITNGSLVSEKIVDFFGKYRFSVQYSFDSILQNSQRKKRTFNQGLKLLQRLTADTNIDLLATPVFTSKSVNKMFSSLVYLKEKGAKNIELSLDLTHRWNIQSRKKLKFQFSLIKNMEIENFKKEGKTLLTLFSDKKDPGIHGCSAGSSQISVSPAGDIWGCPAFTHFKWTKADHMTPDEFVFGNINKTPKENIQKNYIDTILNYKQFRTDNYYTDKSRCFLCKFLEECSLCPAINKNSNRVPRSIFYIPPYICEINKILIGSNRSFNIEKINC